jgi:hypothetical protein
VSANSDTEREYLVSKPTLRRQAALYCAQQRAHLQHLGGLLDDVAALLDVFAYEDGVTGAMRCVGTLAGLIHQQLFW